MYVETFEKREKQGIIRKFICILESVARYNLTANGTNDFFLMSLGAH